MERLWKLLTTSKWILSGNLLPLTGSGKHAETRQLVIFLVLILLSVDAGEKQDLLFLESNFCLSSVSIPRIYLNLSD